MTPFEVRFLVVAGLLHGVGLPVALAIAPAPPSGRWVGAPPAPPSELSIDVAASDFRTSAVVGEPGGRVGPATPREPHTDPRVPSHYDPGPLLLAEPSLEPQADDDNTFPISPDGAADDPLNRPPSRAEVDGVGIPGVDDGLAYLPDDGPSRRPGAPTEAPKREYDPDSGRKAVQDKMREKDAKLGLDFPGRGPIRAAFVGAVYSSGAPDACSAVFSLNVSPSGKVTDISLGAFTGGDSQIWATVRKTVKAELSGVTLVMRSAFSKGAIVSVMVKSERKAPSGGGSGWNGGTGANFDISDIGASDVRVVIAAVNAQPVE